MAMDQMAIDQIATYCQISLDLIVIDLMAIVQMEIYLIAMDQMAIAQITNDQMAME